MPNPQLFHTYPLKLAKNLAKGEIEDYYSEQVQGADKPTKAINACKQIFDEVSASTCAMKS